MELEMPGTTLIASLKPIEDGSKYYRMPCIF
jgi:hypothetical protein